MKEHNASLDDVREAATLRAVLAAEEEDVDLSELRISSIDDQALRAFEAWGSTNYFEWDMVPRWKQGSHQALDLALWFGAELCGLCYAEPSGRSMVVRVILLEGKPDPTHPLKQRVLAISLVALYIYCSTFGMTEIEIECPDAGAVPLYKEFGFGYDAERRLVKSIAED